jgi:signal transduction histidine kinase
MFTLTQYETVPFHFVWVSLSLVYGVRLWAPRTTWASLGAVSLLTGGALLWDVTRTPGGPGLDEMAEVPLMAAMFVAMVWHARRELSARGEVQRLVESQQRLLEREREFVRDASHELRTPITIARGHAELIVKAYPGQQAAADARVILDELDRLARLSERLLVLAAAEHPNFLHRSPVSVEDLLESLARRWVGTAARRWRVEAEGGGTVLADRERLEAAVDALVENAVKFTREGAGIAIRARSEDGQVIIEIQDQGEGIPPEQRAAIFERFARIERDRARDRGGTGLGLALVKAIVEAHGGAVSVDSQPGRGSTFTVRLPCPAPREGVVEPARAGSGPRKRPPGSDGPPGRAVYAPARRSGPGSPPGAATARRAR